MSGQQIKKKNLFKFFKSKEFLDARAKMCAIYIILSYVNELHEDVDRLLQGFDGLFVGDLKHAGKEATRALERYDKQYRAHIYGDGGDLCDATIDVTSALDVAIKQNEFFLQEGDKAIRSTLDEQIENRVKDPQSVEREASENFEICGEEEASQALFVAKKMAKNRFEELGAKNEADLLKGVELGFNICKNWINRLYLEA